MLSVIGKLPSISILLTTGLFCFFASCDSGDIHESEYIHDEGVTLSATFRLNYPELYPDDYNFTFGAFPETGNSPLVSVNLPRSDDEGNVDITLENIPEEHDDAIFFYCDSLSDFMALAEYGGEDFIVTECFNFTNLENEE